jgi:pimeloyl-ACP methyl ester carboxylesterase
MPDLKLDDITLHYEQSGEGPPLLLLAGMLSDSASWGAFFPLLEPYFTVIRADNRTTGRTVPWDAPTSVIQMAKDAQALMQHLGFAQYHLAGHSMGGLMALELAGMEGDKIASLQIMASGPVRAPRTMAIFDTLHAVRAGTDDASLWLRALYPWIFHPAFFDDPQNVQVALKAALAYPHDQSLEAMAHQNEALRGYRPKVDMTGLTCPAQAIFASDDLLIAKEPAWKALQQIPGITEKTIPDTGHSLHWDAPEAVAEILIGFIRSHSD